MPKIADSKMNDLEADPEIAIENTSETEENVRRYLTVVRQIFNHIQKQDSKSLTDLRHRARLRKEKAHR